MTSSSFTVNSSEDDETEVRQCARCGKTFYVDHQGETLSREKCLYHWGKVRYGSIVSGEADRYLDFLWLKFLLLRHTYGFGKCKKARGRPFQMPGLHGLVKNFIRAKRR